MKILEFSNFEGVQTLLTIFIKFGILDEANFVSYTNSYFSTALCQLVSISDTKFLFHFLASLFSNSATKTKLLNNEMVLRNKFFLKI